MILAKQKNQQRNTIRWYSLGVTSHLQSFLAQQSWSWPDLSRHLRRDTTIISNPFWTFCSNSRNHSPILLAHKVTNNVTKEAETTNKSTLSKVYCTARVWPKIWRSEILLCFHTPTTSWVAIYSFLLGLLGSSQRSPGQICEECCSGIVHRSDVFCRPTNNVKALKVLFKMCLHINKFELMLSHIAENVALSFVNRRTCIPARYFQQSKQIQYMTDAWRRKRSYTPGIEETWAQYHDSLTRTLLQLQLNRCKLAADNRHHPVNFLWRYRSRTALLT